MFDHESKIPKDTFTTDKYPSWMKNMFLDIHTEEIFQQGEERGIWRGQVRAAHKFLYLLLTHRFGSIPYAMSNYLDTISDPERLEDVFCQALTVEKIEDLRI